MVNEEDDETKYAEIDEQTHQENDAKIDQELLFLFPFFSLLFAVFCCRGCFFCCCYIFDFLLLREK